MKYSYNWLKEYVLKLPEPKKLVKFLTMRAFEVESCEKAGDDYVLDIKVLPNRAFDCLSHLGMAREIAAIANLKWNKFGVGASKISNLKLNEDKTFKIKDLLRVEVQDKKLCPRYSARVVMDVHVGKSPDWLKDRLMACGLRPINNIVDITNYVMLETGQPLHAFDLDKISGGQIIVRRAKKGEKIITLDEGNPERELDEDVLVIADLEKPIAIAGIKGGKGTEIDGKTTRLALEAANFDPVNTRKSAKKLNLRTDASVRFENSVDINLTIEALNRAVALIQELAGPARNATPVRHANASHAGWQSIAGGGKIVSGIADVLSTKTKSISTAVAHSYIESLLGISIKQADILNIFKRLDLPVKTIKKQKDIFYEVFVSGRRNDLNTSEDLIEEIGRIYGYENIPAKMPMSILVPAVKNEELMNEEKVKNIMVGAGYSEVYNYSLISEKDKEIFGFSNLTGPRYPLSQDQKYLRPSLAVWLFKNVRENLKYFGQVRMFEIGKVFKIDEKQVIEKRMLGGVLADKNTEKDGKNLFYQAKGSLDLLLNCLGVDDAWYDDFQSEKEMDDCYQEQLNIFHPARRAQIKIGDDLVGWLGEINKNVLNALEISAPFVFFEIDFDILNELIEEKIEYKPLSKYPAIVRDLSVLVEANTKIDDVLEIIENTGGLLLADVDLFDIYEQDEGKSFAFRLVFQSYEKNLTDVEVNKLTENIIKVIKEKGWEVRK